MNQNVSEEEKTKSVTAFVNDIETFLKQKETKSVSMVVKDKEIFQKMKNKSDLSMKKIF